MKNVFSDSETRLKYLKNDKTHNPKKCKVDFEFDCFTMLDL
jgi:hypothetical protein